MTQEVLRVKSASLAIHRASHGLAHVRCSGPIGLNELRTLRAWSIKRTESAAGVLADMRNVVCLAPGSSELGDGSLERVIAPRAIVAGPGQVQLWERYALQVADFGVTCAVFVSMQQAHEWLAARACIANCR